MSSASSVHAAAAPAPGEPGVVPAAVVFVTAKGSGGVVVSVLLATGTPATPTTCRKGVGATTPAGTRFVESSGCVVPVSVAVTLVPDPSQTSVPSELVRASAKALVNELFLALGRNDRRAVAPCPIQGGANESDRAAEVSPAPRRRGDEAWSGFTPAEVSPSLAWPHEKTPAPLRDSRFGPALFSGVGLP
jgi:hypothetical protein